VDSRGQGGLLDIALSPKFAADRTIFWTYTEPREGGNGTSVARGVLAPDRRSIEQVRVIFRSMPTYDGRLHFGSRLAFGPDGMLYVTLGERSDASMRKYAQQLDSHLGKVLRITPDAKAPSDNPFVATPGALPEIWTLGHRNVQAAAFDPVGRLLLVIGPVAALLVAAIPLLTLSLVHRAEDAEVVLRVLEVAFGGHPITGTGRVAAELEVLFEKLLGSAPHPHVRPDRRSARGLRGLDRHRVGGRAAGGRATRGS
jgi:hypothetical protein